jgi:SAM-dependent methyltransferase
VRRPQRFRRRRRRLAGEFLRGEGIEIGALNEPQWLPRGTRAVNVDRMPVEELRRQYPELQGVRLAPVDVVDDGEMLRSFEQASVDFVVANHFIEHTEDPVGTIGRLLEVVRPGGILYMAVPDKRLTFDSGRELTPKEHVLRDSREGPESSRHEHYLEFAQYFKGLHGAEAEREAERVRSSGYSIHFHVWTQATFRELLEHLRSELGFPFTLEALEPNHHEFIAVLRKLKDSPAAQNS